jgi:hypothetical protein
MEASILSVTRPPSYWDVAGIHLPFALLTGIPLLIAAWIPLAALPLIPCTFLELTGHPCPFCGFTRSFWAIAQGNWGFAAQNCPLAFLVYGATALLFAWNGSALILGVRLDRGPLLFRRSRRPGRAVFIISLLFLLNWIYRLSLGLT